ncbi:hypothetical protein KJ678_02690 [Patescibacteria group bacterium]|nr:hypothetical protein [Patescibacteria group bacterium]
MLISDDKKHVLDLIENAKKVLVIPDTTERTDALSAALAISFIIKDLSKEVSLLYSKEFPIELKEFENLLDIKKVFDQKSLVVGINYKDTPVEKINYYIKDETLNLVVTPIPSSFDLNRVSFTKTGETYDLIIVIGAKNLGELGNVYYENTEYFRKTPVLSIDNRDETANFGTININEPEFDTLTELMYNKLAVWGFKPNKNAAKALLLGFGQE